MVLRYFFEGCMKSLDFIDDFVHVYLRNANAVLVFWTIFRLKQTPWRLNMNESEFPGFILVREVIKQEGHGYNNMKTLYINLLFNSDSYSS